jgi:hypothetical protein
MFTIIISIMPLSSYRQHTINCTNTFFLASTVFDVNTISCIHYCTSTIDRANEVKTYDLNTVLEEDEVAGVFAAEEVAVYAIGIYFFHKTSHNAIQDFYFLYIVAEILFCLMFCCFVDDSRKLSIVLLIFNEELIKGVLENRGRRIQTLFFDNLTCFFFLNV